MRQTALLTGHFTTIGDIECLEIVQEWVEELGISTQVSPFIESVQPSLKNSIPLEEALTEAESYNYLIVICGPVWRELFEDTKLNLSKFSNAIKVGINLTMVSPLEHWNPFDICLERDSTETTRPDLTLFKQTYDEVRVVARCLVNRQSSYQHRERHQDAISAFNDLVARHNLASFDADTMWNKSGNLVKNATQLTSLLGRADAVLTNRLHGMIFSIKARTPPIVIDAISGTAKVSQQAKVLEWPLCFSIDSLTPEKLNDALEWCSTTEAQAALDHSLSIARRDLGVIANDFARELESDITPKKVEVPRNWLKRKFQTHLGF